MSPHLSLFILGGESNGSCNVIHPDNSATPGNVTKPTGLRLPVKTLPIGNPLEKGTVKIPVGLTLGKPSEPAAGQPYTSEHPAGGSLAEQPRLAGLAAIPPLTLF